MAASVPAPADAALASLEIPVGLAHIDECVGSIVDELEALDLRDDTLFVYAADHGIWSK